MTETEKKKTGNVAHTQEKKKLINSNAEKLQW